ncbi:MAG: succinylglutamate desuccinylase/aspartoacylase family protein [Pseudomonadales bacterium]
MNRRIVFCTVCIMCLAGNVRGAQLSELNAALENTGRHHIELMVGSADQQTALPLTVITGANDGPTLLVLAGVHGSEYSPIRATQKLASAIPHEGLSGSVILIHIANLPAYQKRAVYINPIDGKNINRLFPGKQSGSLSDRIAHTLSKQLFPLADAVLDVHSGDGNEDLRPYWVGYYGKAGNPDVIKKSKALAYAFGAPYIVEFQWELSEPNAAIWAGSSAVAQGVPSIDVEAGGMAVIEPQAVQLIEQGVFRVMTHMGMIEQTFKAVDSPILIRERQTIKSPSDGSWVSLKEAGQKVLKGELLGYVTDWHGRRTFDAISPMDGLILLRLSSPPVNQGESLVVIARTEP